MPSERNQEKLQKLTEFEQCRIISLRDRRFSYSAIAAFVQLSNSTAMLVWKQWTAEHRTTGKTGSGGQNATSACDNRHLLYMAVYDRT